MNDKSEIQNLIKLLENESVKDAIKKIVNEREEKATQEQKKCEETDSKFKKTSNGDGECYEETIEPKSDELELKINELEVKVKELEKNKRDKEKVEGDNLEIFIGEVVKLLECSELEIENNSEADKMKQILDWILALFSNNKSETEKLTQEKNELENNKKKMAGDIAENIKVIKLRDEKINEKDIEIEEKGREIKRKEIKIQEYRGMFEEQIFIYYKYNDLSDKTKDSIKNIFKNVDTIQKFLACGVQEDNVNSLWDYIKQEFIEGKNSDLDNLKMIYEYLLNLFIVANEHYEVQQVELNDKFDVDYHIKHPKGLSSGVVKEIIFKGYINKNTKKPARKTLVVAG